MLDIELVYSPNSHDCVHLHLCLNEEATVADALLQSGLLQTYPEVKDLPLGIFSRPATEKTRLRSGDRIEIYRPLRCDPKEKRRERARTVQNR
jgi:putative ubiquitin-RnfH superfamily antitoxin RatB of RatAB toxin-antitoxin module